MLVRTGAEVDWRPTQQTQATTQPLALSSPGSEPSTKPEEFEPFGNDGLGFFDFLDIINPLHHLPFVGPMYREITGDELSAGPRMMGGALYFGPIGLVGSAIDVVLEEITGEDLGGNILSAFGEESEDAHNTSDAEGTQIVENPAETISLRAEMTGPSPTDNVDPVTAWAMGELSHRNALARSQGIEQPAQHYAHLLPGYPELQNQSGPPNTVPTTRPDEIRRAHLAYRSADLTQRPSNAAIIQNETQADALDETLAGGWFTAAMLDALQKAPPLGKSGSSTSSTTTQHN